MHVYLDVENESQKGVISGNQFWVGSSYGCWNANELQTFCLHLSGKFLTQALPVSLIYQSVR